MVAVILKPDLDEMAEPVPLHPFLGIRLLRR